MMKSRLVRTALSMTHQGKLVSSAQASPKKFGDALMCLWPDFLGVSSEAARKAPSPLASMTVRLIVWVSLPQRRSACSCSLFSVSPAFMIFAKQKTAFIRQ